MQFSGKKFVEIGSVDFSFGVRLVRTGLVINNILPMGNDQQHKQETEL